MREAIRHITGGGDPALRRRAIGMYAALLGVNLALWAAALAIFRPFPLLLGTCFLAYSFGLRHAVDADHIAAIDNVTRKLMQDGQRPVGVGLWFSLGHSTIVFGLSVAVALTAAAARTRFGALTRIGDVAGTLLSAFFLLAIAVMNVLILRAVLRIFRRVRDGGTYDDEDLNLLLARRGVFGRLFRGLFGLVRHDWQMYPVGVLFGLGFDTATEVGLLGISAAGASNGLPVWSILMFPALFAAGMALVDTADSILMLGAYGWAFARPVRKLYYNITITAVSVLVAVIVGAVETLGMIQGEWGLSGPFWAPVAALNAHFGLLGYMIIGIFVTSWIVSVGIYRLRGYDRIDVKIAE